MKNKKLRITEKDFLLANRRASRAEEIEKYGKQILMRSITHKSKKVYDRKRLKRQASTTTMTCLYSFLPLDLFSQLSDFVLQLRVLSTKPIY